MDIQTIPVSKIKPAAYNPRVDLQPDDPEYQAIKRSIDTFGFVEPLVWNKKTGNLVGGHQRLKILKDQGKSDVECVIVDLDERDEKALNIALNKAQGSWDMPKLKDLLADLDVDGFDLTVTGFSEDELQKLTDQFHVSEIESPELSDGDRAPFRQATFTLHDDQWEDVEAAIAKAKQAGGGVSAVNENSNGNALAFICAGFIRG